MSFSEFVGSALRLAILVTSLADVSVQGSFSLANVTMPANEVCPMLLVASHYTEMSCKVGTLRNSSFLNCPRDYKCNALDLRPKAQCVYKGRIYEVNDMLPSKYLHVRCRHSCVCLLDSQGFASFVCKYRKCAPVKPECRQTYANPTQCCPHAECDPPKAKEVTCLYKNKTFSAGEVMDNTFNNTRCICRKGFRGVMRAPFCHPVQCGIELDYPMTMRKGCSPVYSVNVVHIQVGKDIMTSIFDFLRERLLDLCPIRWSCPSEDDVVVPLTSMAPDIPVLDSDSNCRYGNNDMSMLDVAMSPEQGDGSCTMCICVVPPTLLCIHKTSCWTF